MPQVPKGASYSTLPDPFLASRQPRQLTIFVSQSVACGFLSFPQFFLLAALRHTITLRLNLTTPILTGLFYIAPAGGFLLGTIAGRRLSDITVKRWINKRNGLRIREDRLRNGVFSLFVLIPAGYRT